MFFTALLACLASVQYFTFVSSVITWHPYVQIWSFSADLVTWQIVPSFTHRCYSVRPAQGQPGSLLYTKQSSCSIMHKIMHTSVKTALTHSGFVKHLLLEQYDLQVPLEQVMKKVVCRWVILHSPLLLWGCADVSRNEDQNCLLHSVHKYSIENAYLVAVVSEFKHFCGWLDFCAFYTIHGSWLEMNATFCIQLWVFCCRGFDTDGAEVVRPYTPTTLDSDVGFFELVVKVRSRACSTDSSGRTN